MAPAEATTTAETTTTNTNTTLTMKLLVDTKSQSVLFAEAGKDVVDFLFSLLALPIATAAELVCGDSMVGSFGNVYSSVDKLDSTYLLAGVAKDTLLRPAVASPAVSTNSCLLLPPVTPKTMYRCTGTSSSNCRSYVTDCQGKACPTCGSQMVTEAQSLTSAAGSGSGGKEVQNTTAGEGFVQGIVTYTVLDNLTVRPMSAISSITLLSTFAVDLAALQEKTVELGYKEGVEILRASLQSKTVLTDVFLRKKASSTPST